jgi:DeoR/GlpR family transcriptional regulator of sugar metabolism
MLREDRQDQILHLLNTKGKVIASELCEELNVSEDTIRRDLRELSARGLIRRVHGGALPIAPSHTKYEEREHVLVEEKKLVAKKAASLIKNGQLVLLDGSTTASHMVQYFPADLKCTIITNSPRIALSLSSFEKVDTIMIGGAIFKNSEVCTGSLAIEALSRFRPDICLLGIYCIHPDEGITDLDLEEAYMKQKMIEISSQVAGLVTTNKLDRLSEYMVTKTGSLTHLITELDPSHERLSKYKTGSITVL